jgi:hypothetical protein
MKGNLHTDRLPGAVISGAPYKKNKKFKAN